MTFELSGATRLIAIIGDPIAQVKSPAGVTQRMRELGHDIICVPLHVSAADFDSFMAISSALRNLDGIIATVPHKFSALAACASASERATFTGAANVLRRASDHAWHGDMVDGIGFVSAQRRAGFDPAGHRVLLVGAGGAGSAIAFALLEAGVAMLAVHDADTQRRDALVARLSTRFAGRVEVGSVNASGFDMVANATPMGMREGDACPVDAGSLRATMHVGDVVTVPEVTPLLAAARAAGCTTQTGVGMFREVLALMVAFFCTAPAQPEATSGAPYLRT